MGKHAGQFTIDVFYRAPVCIKKGFPTKAPAGIDGVKNHPKAAFTNWLGINDFNNSIYMQLNASIVLGNFPRVDPLNPINTFFFEAGNNFFGFFRNWSYAMLIEAF